MSTALAYRNSEVGERRSPPGATHAQTDGQVIRMWLHGKSPNTIEAYSRDISRFLRHAGRALSDLCLEDLQGFADSLDDLAAATRARKLAAIKSLLTFAHEIGYVRFNVGRAVKLPKSKNTLAERILSESQVQKIINQETDARNRMLLRLLYAAGLRVSEICGLRWRDVQERDDSGQITVYGKGEKTRHVLLSADTWRELMHLRAGAGEDDAVFESQKGGWPLTRSGLEHCQPGRRSRRHREERLAALAAACTRLTRARSRGSGPPGQGYARSRLAGHDVAICARAAGRFECAVLGRLRHSCFPQLLAFLVENMCILTTYVNLLR